MGYTDFRKQVRTQVERALSEPPGCARSPGQGETSGAGSVQGHEAAPKKDSDGRAHPLPALSEFQGPADLQLVFNLQDGISTLLSRGTRISFLQNLGCPLTTH